MKARKDTNRHYAVVILAPLLGLSASYYASSMCSVFFSHNVGTRKYRTLAFI